MSASSSSVSSPTGSPRQGLDLLEVDNSTVRELKDRVEELTQQVLESNRLLQQTFEQMKAEREMTEKKLAGMLQQIGTQGQTVGQIRDLYVDSIAVQQEICKALSDQGRDDVVQGVAVRSQMIQARLQEASVNDQSRQLEDDVDRMCAKVKGLTREVEILTHAVKIVDDSSFTWVQRVALCDLAPLEALNKAEIRHIRDLLELTNEEIGAMQSLDQRIANDLRNLEESSLDNALTLRQEGVQVDEIDGINQNDLVELDKLTPEILRKIYHLNDGAFRLLYQFEQRFVISYLRTLPGSKLVFGEKFYKPIHEINSAYLAKVKRLCSLQVHNDAPIPLPQYNRSLIVAEVEGQDLKRMEKQSADYGEEKKQLDARYAAEIKKQEDFIAKAKDFNWVTYKAGKEIWINTASFGFTCKPEDVSSLVETVETYDKESQTFKAGLEKKNKALKDEYAKLLGAIQKLKDVLRPRSSWFSSFLGGGGSTMPPVPEPPPSVFSSQVSESDEESGGEEGNSPDIREAGEEKEEVPFMDEPGEKKEGE